MIGGDNHFRPEFFRNLRKICDEYELLLILDEIQTGIGLTGKMWTYEHFEVIPDIVCFCKKNQIGGIATTARIDEVDNVFTLPNRIGSTFGGNLVDMVRATRFLQIIEEEKFVDNAGKMGSLLIEEIQKLASLYPEKITNVRGLGLLVAFDLPTKEEREEFVKRCFDKRLLLMIAEPKTIRLRPFLDIGKEDINKMVSIFNNVLNDMR